MEKPELCFEIPNNVGVMIALVHAIPASWANAGWVDGYFSTGRGKPVTLIEAGREFPHFGISFEETRTYVVDLLSHGHRGWLEFCKSGYGHSLADRPAVCHMQLASWHGTKAPEIGDQPARLRLSWHQFVKNARPGGYEPVVDVDGSGTFNDVAPIVDVCRRLRLREYELTRAEDWYDYGPQRFAIAAE